MSPGFEPPFPDGKFTLSVIIPVYNERETVREIVDRVRAVDLDLEVIVVDDGSTDGTRDIVKDLERAGRIHKAVYPERNRGKGAAIRAAIQRVSGDIVVIQDADLEYDPQEYARLIQPILEGKADVVFGSRFFGGMPHRVLLYWHSVANWFLTRISNMVTNVNLTDMETCYKVFRTEVLKRIVIQENGFGFEPEVTAKVARLRCRIYEVGISYFGRGYDEGKKIKARDALWALICVLRYGFFQRLTRGGLAAPPDSVTAAAASSAPAAEEVEPTSSSRR